VGDVRPPITKFADLGAEGADRVKKIKVLMDELDLLLAKLAS
jgi:4-hydroxy-tetrahydrodipicolinate synthase